MIPPTRPIRSRPPPSPFCLDPAPAPPIVPVPDNRSRFDDDEEEEGDDPVVMVKEIDDDDDEDDDEEEDEQLYPPNPARTSVRI